MKKGRQYVTAAKGQTPIVLSRTHRILIGVVVAGAVVIAGIGFAGSYAAVRKLAEQKGFGSFSVVFPIGIDAGICVLLALDLLLTWIRIPFPLLRQTAWLLTAATIAFNGAAAWPDPLGVGMHAVIPILFVVCVEAARHAVGRIADITADKHMEGVRLTRWLLSPVPTFKLWRRMKLWELRSYEQVIKLEQDRLIYQARLQARFGRNWRRKAPVESLMPLRLARFGVPLAETAPAGLAAAGIKDPAQPPALLAEDMPALVSPPVDQAEPEPEHSSHWFTNPQHQEPNARQEAEPSREAEAPTGEETTQPGDAALGSNTDWQQPGPDVLRELEELDALREEELSRAQTGQVGMTGATADRTGGSGRVVVQMRLPDQGGEPDREPAHEEPESPREERAGEDGGADEEQPEEPTAANPDDLKGIDLVEWHYRNLPEQRRKMSANALAPQLADVTGYKVGTVRKYLGAIKRPVEA
ncbi:DUF2637 domain-containing protein [Streptomyces sp. NPDC056486]|uniref:DUF2637 domain-containing protein n=1 Tax=Streptomyces sp. NPDC056486 TaxID=3345835 RepID=UPI0036A1DC5B